MNFRSCHRTVKKISCLMILFCLLGTVVQANAAATISLNTPVLVKVVNETTGEATERKLTVSGYISTGAGNQVAILIKDPTGQPVGARQTTSGENGYFEFNYMLDAVAVEGTYGVTAGGFNVMQPQTCTFDFAVPNNEADICTYQLEGVMGTINGNKIEVTVPSGSDIGEMTAIFTTSPNATVKIGNIVQTSGTAKNDFTIPLVYTVTSENLKTVKQYTVKVEVQPWGEKGKSGGSRGSSNTSFSFSDMAAQVNSTNESPMFNDIAGVEWAREYIQELARKGIVSGTGKSTFEPERAVTREEFIKMLVMAFSLEDQNSTTTFTDVAQGMWYYPYIASAQKAGITTGIGDNLFGVERLITRQEMATMAYRVSQMMNINFSKVNDSQDFADENAIDAYAKKAIAEMQQANVINGMENNYFAPNEKATRAQAAKVIYLLFTARNAK